MIRNRIRLRFGKMGDLRFIGHRDLIRMLMRLFRRAGLQLRLSEGFHPKPRVHFPAALAVGVVGACEVVEVELADEMPAAQALAMVQRLAPAELVFLSAEAPPPGSAKAELARAQYEVDVPTPKQIGLADRIAWCLAQTSYPIWREGRRRSIDIRPFVDDLALADGHLKMTLLATRQGSARPREVLDALHLTDLERDGCVITRTEVELRP